MNVLKKIFFIELVLLFILEAFSIFSYSVRLQQAASISTDNNYYQVISPMVGNDNVQGRIANPPEDVKQVDWRWLLPLLAIPLIYFFWRMMVKTTNSHEVQPSAGTKGGKVGRKRTRKKRKVIKKKNSSKEQ